MLLTGDIYFPKQDHEKQMIRSIWHAAGNFPREQQEHIMPSGAAELIFNFSDPILFHYTGNTEFGLPKCFINGVNITDFTVIKKTNQHFLGMQLYPYAIKVLLGLPAYELTNSVVDLTLISEELNTVWHQLAECEDFSFRVNVLLSWFTRQLLRHKVSNDIDRIQDFYGARELNSACIRKIADRYSLSERSLRRKCNEWLGMSTEAFTLYRKYLQSLELLHNAPLSLTEIGNRSGYYDQSHFIREFKSFTSLTPKEYRAQKSIIPGHIFRML